MSKEIKYSFEFEPFSNSEKNDNWYWVLWFSASILIIIFLYFTQWILIILTLMITGFISYFAKKKIPAKQVIFYYNRLTIDEVTYHYEEFEFFYIFGVKEKTDISKRLILPFKKKVKLSLSLPLRADSSELEDLENFLLTVLDKKYIEPSIFDALIEKLKL